MKRLLVPGGVAFAIEPVANSPVLQRLRRATPVPVEATPDERQLTYEDLERMRAHGFTDIEYTHFYLTERVWRVAGEWTRRPLRGVDRTVQRVLPALRRFYGIVLVRST